uniref:VWA domain-containing protein n=1 Tax=Thaumasiovibrio occultus TaxID=1891184 RepID=UPI000B3574B3|nr:VWA domain-containing protein [Thaumasiovibrio occultus]
MIEFEHLWALLLLPLPLIARALLPIVQPAATLRLPSLPTGLNDIRSVSRLPLVLLVLLWISLVTALARPIWLGEPVTLPSEHRDVMLVVDLSGSMEIDDMKDKQGNAINRLEAVKLVLQEFVEQREGDRLGMVVFADHAYLHTPLTRDIDSLSGQIKQLLLGLVGSKTAIGEGLAVATKTFIDNDAPQRVIILLSDGENNVGHINPIEAAELAAKRDVTVYTIGMGADTAYVDTLFGRQLMNPSKDLDEHTLSKVAEIANGRYFRARSREELAQIYDVINELEAISQSDEAWRPRTDLFQYPLFAAMLFGLVLANYRRRHG